MDHIDVDRRRVSLRPYVLDVDAQDRCDKVIELHAASAEGQAIDRGAWRRARSALSQATALA